MARSRGVRPPRDILSRATLERLVGYEKIASGKRFKNYIDPQTGAVYTQREKQTSQKAGVTPESYAHVGPDAKRLINKARARDVNIESGLRRMAQKNNMTPAQVARSRDFYRALAGAVRRRAKRRRAYVADLFEMEIDEGDFYTDD